MPTQNLGILAHVDAGKTSLTERLLFDANVIRTIGSVDGGDTHTDSLSLERQRGITIKSAVVSFKLGDLTINLVDTPGHPDFIAEVERVLNLLDCAILVVSAVEGVQPQTRILMRALQRLRIPTLIFINKIDRMGADVSHVFEQIQSKLAANACLLGEAAEQGTKCAKYLANDPENETHRTNLIEKLSEANESLLADYIIAPDLITSLRLQTVMAEQTSQSELTPVLCGSATTGTGCKEVQDAIKVLLPNRNGDEHAPLSATAFKNRAGLGRRETGLCCRPCWGNHKPPNG